MHQWLIHLQSGKFVNTGDLLEATVEGCLISVTLSDFTAIAAFAFGCITPFPAVKLCCAYLALCVSTLWLSELLFLLPCLAIKTDRFFKSQSASPPAEVNEMQAMSYTEPTSPRKANVFNLYERFITHTSVYLTSKTLFRMFWVFWFLTVTGFSIYHMSKMRALEDNVKYYQDDSVTKEFYSTLQTHLTNRSLATNLIISVPSHIQHSAPISDSKFVSEIKALNKSFTNSKIFTSNSWFDCFLKLMEQNKEVCSKTLVEKCSQDAKYLIDEKSNESRKSDQKGQFDESISGCFSNDNVVIKLIKVSARRVMTTLGDVEQQNVVLHKMQNIEEEFEEIRVKIYDWNVALMWRDYLMSRSLWKSVLMAGHVKHSSTNP